ncbi:aryl hydrocarbon receptor nuclear translocator-like protein 1 isoform X3 [Venturia canescens]|uniref:aryl hydrocarbon receptor nuclear translocator-like protein 1 isoform X3 n=1 Tax=Venturia canescens TaxID=32260 RepID=UPI001C9C9A0E|nr:aryl hydrocarbon receptor nuclear translocator-like protein 1 isoform X3 [Venturia canescens]
MVAQDMAQSYNRLFHTNQEPQEFISLDELPPPHRIHNESQTCPRQHQWLSTSGTTAHLYPSSALRNCRNPDDEQDDADVENDNDSASRSTKHVQQRTYYNLSSAIQRDSCSAVYFGGADNNSRIIGDRETGAVDDRQTCNNDPNLIIDPIHTDNDSNSEQTTNKRSRPIWARVRDDALTSGDNHRRRRHPHHSRLENRFQIDDSPSLDETNSEPCDDFSPGLTNKRKISLQDDNESTDAIGDEPKFAKPNTDSKKQNHSEIEKRRRDKMNTYITELSAMIPMCHAMSRKLDKLTVLRMAVQHLKTILGAVTSYTEVHYKPTFISDQELKTLILQAAEGFVFVVGCDRGRILYVSESVSQILNYTQDDLLGQSWFDILHPKDVAKVKEQLSSSDLSPRERLIDAKTMLPVKTDVPQGVSRLCPGARRSFFCRMKRKLDVTGSSEESQVKEEAYTGTRCHRRKKQQTVDWKYCVIHCTGYLKSWAPAKIGLEEHEGDGDGEGCSLSCLVAVGRIQPALPSLSRGPNAAPLKTVEFISRHAIDGKFLFVDQRSTLVLGFLPQELLGTSLYEYFHHDDIPHLADSHKAALQGTENVITRSHWKSFRNPWTKDIEYLISKNSAVYCDTGQVDSSVNRSEGLSVKDNYDYFAESNGGLERLISSHVEMSKIGRRIAEQVLDNQRRNEDSCSVSSPNSIAQERGSTNTEFQVTNIVASENIRDISHLTSLGSAENRMNSGAGQTIDYNPHIGRDSVHAGNGMANAQGTQPDDDMLEMIGGTVLNESPNALPSDGNDEAAMAVIMSLLEADAGLGGPVDFSGLPWPLP